MKRFSFKRMLALCLSLLMMLSSLTAVLTFTVSAAPKKEYSIQNGTGQREPIRIGEGFSYRAKLEYVKSKQAQCGICRNCKRKNKSIGRNLFYLFFIFIYMTQLLC